MKNKIKVALEFLGHFRNNETQDYKVTKIIGAPTVEVSAGNGYITIRVGEIINERQATELAEVSEVTTTRRSHESE